MTTTEFEQDDQGIIIVWARLEGPNGSRDLQLALDTGAAMTLVVPEALDRLGYSARDGDKDLLERVRVDRDRAWHLDGLALPRHHRAALRSASSNLRQGCVSSARSQIPWIMLAR